MLKSEEELYKVLGTDRWLMDMGLIPDNVQQTLLAFGYLSSDLVTNVHLNIDVNSKKVGYRLFIKDYTRYEAVQMLKKSDTSTLVGKGLKLLGLKLGTDIRMEENIRKSMKDYLPSYAVEVSVEHE